MRILWPVIGGPPGRHLWVDVAVTTPDTAEALRAGSAEMSGTAARLRERKMHRKYGATVDRVGGCFRAGVMERFIWGCGG